MSYHYIKIGDRHPFVEAYFDIQGQCERLSDLIIPDGTPGLMFVVEGEFIRNDSSGQKCIQEGSVYLFGHKTRSVEYQFNQKKLIALGLKLKPASLYELFGVSASKMTDRVVEVPSCKREADTIYSKIKKDGESVRDKMHALLSIIPHQNTTAVPTLVGALLSYIHESLGSVSVRQLAEKFGVGYKKLERLFKMHVGVTPKIYARIIRFNHCMKYGMSRSSRNLTEVAYQFGFFDQTHFNKEIKRFTGLKPSEVFCGLHSPVQQQQIRYISSRGF